MQRSISDNLDLRVESKKEDSRCYPQVGPEESSFNEVKNEVKIDDDQSWSDTWIRKAFTSPYNSQTDIHYGPLPHLANEHH